MGNALRNILRFPKRRQPSEELDKLVVQIKELEGQLTRLVEQRSGYVHLIILEF
jgi:chorismate mutase